MGVVWPKVGMVEIFLARLYIQPPQPSISSYIYALSAVVRGRHIAAVLICYCVSYDTELENVVAGACFFNCEPNKKHQFTRGMRMILPCNSHELDNQTCRPFKRTGRLCGKCLPGYSPLVYSYNMSCMECPDGSKNWWKFILAAFGPLTLFYFFILFFQVNIVSSSLHTDWCICYFLSSFL